MRALVVGGTSGLGLELAKLLKEKGYEVLVTGRTNPNVEGLEFHKLDMGIDQQRLAEEIAEVGQGLSEPIEFLIYAAGFFQEGRIGRLEALDMMLMTNVGLLAPCLFVGNLVRQAGYLHAFIAITSTSQWTPRVDEPVYTGVKAGLAMFANSVSLDRNVGQVLVAAPSGMKTKFWADTDRDTAEMLEPKWVAEQILNDFLALPRVYKYRFIKLLRGPARVEVVETRGQ